MSAEDTDKILDRLLGNKEVMAMARTIAGSCLQTAAIDTGLEADSAPVQYAVTRIISGRSDSSPAVRGVLAGFANLLCCCPLFEKMVDEAALIPEDQVFSTRLMAETKAEVMLFAEMLKKWGIPFQEVDGMGIMIERTADTDSKIDRAFRAIQEAKDKKPS